MASEVNEIRTYFGRCRCCLEYGYLKNMWTVHHWEGDSEIYGEMITECFAFTLERPNNVDHDQICETCISRLRDACSFKYTVIKSQRLLMQEIPLGGDTVSIKLEDVKPEGSIEIDIDDQIIDNTQDMLEENIDLGIPIITEEAVVIDELPYEDVEYLEEEVVGDKTKQHSEDLKPVDSDGSGPSKRKWPKKLPRNERNQRYLQYTEEDLRKGIEAVKSQKMSRLEASEYYNVPRKTLCARLRMEAENVARNDKSELSTNHSNTFIESPTESDVSETDKASTQSEEVIIEVAEIEKHRHNLSMILQYSNATMVRGHWGMGYACCFCKRKFPLASQLKRHNLRDHQEPGHNPLQVKRVADLLLKLDITGLRCRECKFRTSSLNQVIRHLKKKHGVLIYKVKDYIVPFRFETEELQCALCVKEFENFRLLSAHTNEHFKNFECLICSRWFINEHSLEVHTHRHQRGTFECSYCSSIFETVRERSKHVQSSHYLCNKSTECPHCDESFQTDLQLEKHKIATHEFEEPVYKCCNTKFVNETYLKAHQKRFHLLVRPHKCFSCDMSFYSEIELSIHRVKAKGNKKYTCEICEKAYNNQCKLNQHARLHFDDTRFRCEYCNQNFVRKSAWEEHMRNIHPTIIKIEL